MQIHINNQENFQQKKEAMTEAGFDTLNVIADFDRTLTYGTIDGKKIPSLISLLRDYNYLNDFCWDDQGYALPRNAPVIHSLNKDETTIQQFPEIHEKIKERKNILLLWDSLWDLWMSTGFGYDTQISIGFLNTWYNTNREEYREKFDVALEWDGDINFVHDIMK